MFAKVIDLYDPSLYDIPIEPYRQPEKMTLEEQVDHKVKYEFEVRMIREENDRRRAVRQRLFNDPDYKFEQRLAEIRRKTQAGEFPDKLIDESISQSLCDPNSYVRRYAMSKYGFKQNDLTSFAQAKQPLSQQVKNDANIHDRQVEKVLRKLKTELKH